MRNDGLVFAVIINEVSSFVYFHSVVVYISYDLKIMRIGKWNEAADTFLTNMKSYSCLVITYLK